MVENVDQKVLDRWQRFRDGRTKALSEPIGWLSLTALHWLDGEPRTYEGVPGLWSATGRASEGGHAVLSATESDGLRLAGVEETGTRPVDGTITASMTEDASLPWVTFGDVLVELAVRDDKYAIRLHDPNSPLLAEFAGVPMFEYAPDAVVEGRFVPYADPVFAEIGTALGYRTDAEFVGEVTFTLAGQEYTFPVEPDKLGSLILNFFDATNGESTDHWRKLQITKPRPDGTVVLDFNRAINYPSAFTDFGTCPMPLERNVITTPVEAGEKKYR